MSPPSNELPSSVTASPFHSRTYKLELIFAQEQRDKQRIIVGINILNLPEHSEPIPAGSILCNCCFRT